MEFFITCVGMMLGSFLNVCIFRIPRRQSLILPGSQCVHCQQPLKLQHKVPLISYLALRGSSHCCSRPIPKRYPIVEFAAGLATLLAYLNFGLSPHFVFYTVFLYFLLVISFIDINTGMIHNRVLVVMLAAGAALNGFFSIISWPFALGGLLAGGASMFAIALLGRLVLRKESLGMGDIKFIAVAGFFLGSKMIFSAIIFAFFIAAVSGGVAMATRRISASDPLPFGPFLAAAMVVFLFWGSQVIHYYWQLMGGTA